MLSIKNVLSCVGWNFFSQRKNPRLYLCMLLGFLLCWMLTDKTMSISRTYQTGVQVFEPFIWCFADSSGVLYVSLTLILLMAEFPRLDTSASYLMFRAHRMPWLTGQIITALLVTFGFCLFMLMTSIIVCIGNVSTENRWSDTATMLSFAPSSFDLALIVTRKTVKLTLPYQCVVQIFLLMFQYMMLLSMIQITMTLIKSRKMGICIVTVLSLMGFVMTPDRFMIWLSLPSGFKYYANLLSVWCSPLQHATYLMHNFGYDSLPSIPVSHSIMGGISIMLSILAYKQIDTFDFQFIGGNHDSN